MLGSLALTLFLFRHQNSDPSTRITVGVMMLVIYLPFGVPAVGKFIADRPRTVLWIGVAMIPGGLAAMLGLFFTSAYYGFPRSVTGTDPISMVTMWIMMAGIALTILPRSMAALKRTEKAGAARKIDQPSRKEFSGIDEAWSALQTVVRDWAPFARLAGPWIILLWAVPFIGLHIAAFNSGTALSLLDPPIGKVDTATELLAERLPTIVVSAFAFPIALVNWHRYILSGTLPRIGLSAPLGVTARYLWRLWMIVLLFSILIRLAASNAPDVARLLGTPDKLLVAEILFWGVLCVEVFLGSSFALVLPAVAMGNRNFLGTDSLRVSKPLGNSFRMGFVFSLLPFVLAWWAIAELLDRFAITGPRLSLASYSLWLMPTAAMFLALTSCATYLSRIYAARLTAEPAESTA